MEVIQKAWDNLDSGLKQWIINGIAMAVSFIPIAGPILSCVIDGTFVDMFKAIMKGDWATVALLGIGAVCAGIGVLKILKNASATTKYSRYMSEIEREEIRKTGSTVVKSSSGYGTHVVPPGAPRTSIASKAEKMQGLQGKPKYRADFNIENYDSLTRKAPEGASRWAQECFEAGQEIQVSGLTFTKMNSWLPSWFPW